MILPRYKFKPDHQAAIDHCYSIDSTNHGIPTHLAGQEVGFNKGIALGYMASLERVVDLESELESYRNGDTIRNMLMKLTAANTKINMQLDVIKELIGSRKKLIASQEEIKDSVDSIESALNGLKGEDKIVNIVLDKIKSLKDKIWKEDPTCLFGQ